MLDLHFVVQNIGFAVNLFAGAVFFLVSWLYFDAWLGRNKPLNKDMLIWVGYLSLDISFLVLAGVLGDVDRFGIFSSKSLLLTSQSLALLGLICIALAQYRTPLQKIPRLKILGLGENPLAAEEEIITSKKNTKETKKKATASAIYIGNITLAALIPIAAFVTALLYWKRATKGLEAHLKPLAKGFFVLTGYYVASLAGALSDSSNPQIANFFRDFGPVWIIKEIFLIAALIIFSVWAWGYLVKRLVTQLLVIVTTLTVTIFVITTVCFGYIQENYINNRTLGDLNISSDILNYSVDSKKAESQAITEALAKDQQIVNAVANGNHKTLVNLTKTYLGEKSKNTLLITDTAGKVLQRAADPDYWGDSISSDTGVRRALVGQSSTTVRYETGVAAPMMQIVSFSPLRTASGSIVGIVAVGTYLDNSFVDTVKSATKLETSIYAMDYLVATTFVGADNKTRLVGTKLVDDKITDRVLKSGHIYSGSSRVAGQNYIAVYSPMLDKDGSVAGMLMIARPQAEIINAANEAISKTFLIATALLMFSIIPVFAFSSYLTKQVS